MEKPREIPNHIKTGIQIRQLNLKLSRISSHSLKSDLLVGWYMGVLPMRKSLVPIYLN